VRTSWSSDERGVLSIGGSLGEGEALHEFEPVEVNVVEGRRPRLVPVPGTTRLWGAAPRVGRAGKPVCTKSPVDLGGLPDGLHQAGVLVDVVGYVPREPCDTHARWVISEYRVAEG
jgi:hypothetical protein